MNRLLIYSILLALVSCANDALTSNAPDEPMPQDEGAGEMCFMPRAAVLSRASSDGLYNQTYYPVNSLFLTAYHRDNLDLTQWYFKDIKLDALNSTEDPLEYNGSILEDGIDKRIWKATGWYWPIQGKMEFLSYWSPKVYGTPSFYEYTHANGSKSAQMVVNARGVYNGTDKERYEGLDGYTDFLFIAQNNIPCPQVKPFGLTYRHGLAWLTLSLQATVPLYDASGKAISNSIDEVKTQELIDKVKVQKIVIEDVSRRGVAYLVPGLDVAWDVASSDIKDQMYTRPETSTYPRGTYAYFTWDQVTDGRSEVVNEYVTLSKTRQYLGLYTPSLYNTNPDNYQPETNPDTEYVGNGIFIIPQHKTAITVYFKILDGKNIYDEDGNVIGKEDLEAAYKYELRDNQLEWEPGKRYLYDITFSTPLEELKNKLEVRVVETTYEVKVDPVTTCYDYEAFGQVITTNPDGTTGVPYKAATFVLDPLHNEGSPFWDEMDYFDGGQIF